MPRAEAEQFLQERAGSSVCIRYYQRADGTILTEDCPVGVSKKRRKKVALAVAGAGAMALAGASLLGARTTCHTVTGATMGEMPVPVTTGSVAVPAPEVPPEPEGIQGQMRMGDWAGPQDPTPPPPPAPAVRHFMGKKLR
jgi:hypothetical protein